MATKSEKKAGKNQAGRQERIDPVAESSDESFPASDPPAWTTSGDSRSELKKRRKKRG